MKEMVRRVAEASFKAFCERNNLDYKFEEMDSEEMDFAEKHAIACIMAMHEPTDEMVKEGEAEMYEERAEAADWTLKACRDAWRIMIEEAVANAQTG